MGVCGTEEGSCEPRDLRPGKSLCAEDAGALLCITNCSPRDHFRFLLSCSEMDCKFRFDLSSKGHRKDGDKSRNRKDDDSLAEASHSKKTVKKAGNGVSPDSCSLVMGSAPSFSCRCDSHRSLTSSKATVGASGKCGLCSCSRGR